LLETLLQIRIGSDLAVHHLERTGLPGAPLLDDVEGPHPARVERPNDDEVAADHRARNEEVHGHSTFYSSRDEGAHDGKDGDPIGDCGKDDVGACTCGD
jgi:hypothetical protein